MEMHRPQFNHPVSSPTNSTIDESPISPASPSKVLPAYSQNDDAAPVTVEKSQVQPPQEVHPAFFAPYRDENPQVPKAQPPQQQPQPQSQQQTQQPRPLHSGRPEQQSLHAQNSQPSGPITLTSPGGTTSAPPVPVLQSPVQQPPKPVIEPDTHYPAPPLNPSNVDGTTHLPGQATKRSTDSPRQWKHGLCDPSPVCCTALFCPCLVYGKTMYRLSRKTAKQDPTDLLGYESCNSACALISVACGFQWVLASIQRTRIRKTYEIEGGIGEDCIAAICCCCCVLAQDEREMRDREDEERKRFSPAGTAAYASPGGMAYAPPPR